MKVLMNEYVKSIIYITAGVLVIASALFIIYRNSDVLFPEAKTAVEFDSINSISNSQPYIILNTSMSNESEGIEITQTGIKIKAGSEKYNAMKYANDKTSTEYKQARDEYIKLVTAYENLKTYKNYIDTGKLDSAMLKCNVYGIEDININKEAKGNVYTITYQAMNSKERILLKRVTVLIN